MARGVAGVTGLPPFFRYFGGKNRAAGHYPEPDHQLIVEPFAGAAGYASRHPDHDVLLIDRDPVIVDTWRYLLAATPDDIMALPDLEDGQTVADLALERGAGYLIGWWVNSGSAQPCQRPSAWMRTGHGLWWGPRLRERIAANLPAISHWQVQLGTYADAPDVEATWFIDPPYIVAGRKYRHGSRGIDYGHLADWSKTRQGQVMVCENEGAEWLPFRPLFVQRGSPGRQKPLLSRTEVIWP